MSFNDDVDDDDDDDDDDGGGDDRDGEGCLESTEDDPYNGEYTYTCTYKPTSQLVNQPSIHQSIETS